MIFRSRPAPVRREPVFDPPPPRLATAQGPAAQAAPLLPAGAVPSVPPPRAAIWLALATSAALMTLPVLVQSTSSPLATVATATAAADDDLVTGAIVVPITSPGFLVGVAAGPDPQRLWQDWPGIAGRLGSSLAGLAPSVIKATDAAADWHLTVGSFRNGADAAESCGHWRAAGLTCTLLRADGSVVAGF